MSELKPCPFCGESKLLYSGGCGFRYDDDDNQIRLFRVHCRTCKGRTGLFESLDEAVEAWNRRTNSTTIQPSELGTNLASLGTDCSKFPNNSDAISRQEAIDAIRDMQAFEDDNGQPYLYLCDVMEVFTDEEELPPIQPEIVRCKDCKHWKDSDGVFRRGIGVESKCPLNLHQVYEGTFYCGLGERREVQDENDKTTNNTTNA